MDFSDNKIGSGTDGLVSALARYKSRILYLSLSKYGPEALVFQY